MLKSGQMKKLKTRHSKAKIALIIIVSLIIIGLIASGVIFWLNSKKISHNSIDVSIASQPQETRQDTQPKEPSDEKKEEKPMPSQNSKPATEPTPRPAPDKNPSTPTYVNQILIVNKSYKLPAAYAPSDLITGIQGQLYSKSIDVDLQAMFKAATGAGLNIIINSAYRSYNTQANLYANYSARDGQAAADRYSARAGHSEHQTGLALDLGGAKLSSDCNFSDCFATSAESAWLSKNSSKYGFILRYPLNKESITGFMYEPWHFRYVGKAIAEDMKAKGALTLEEYLGVKGGLSY